MGWREDLIDRFKFEIVELRDEITLMEAGSLEFRTRKGGDAWVSKNAERIAKNHKTIELLESLITRAEAKHN